MLNALKRFREDEDGAITVEWVVLTGAVGFMAILVLTIVSAGAETLATNVAADLSSM